MAETPLVPLVEAAGRLQVSWARAWRLVLIGQLAGRQVGGRWLVEEASLRALERRPHPPAPPTT